MPSILVYPQLKVLIFFRVMNNKTSDLIYSNLHLYAVVLKGLNDTERSYKIL